MKENLKICEICGSEIEVNTNLIGHAICKHCDLRIMDYQRRVDVRVERMEARAEKNRIAAQSEIAQAHNMAQAIPFGQPILVGHHSEKRDRNYRNRIERTYRRGFERLAKAERQKERAAAAEKNRAISMDDPSAVIKLQTKLDELVALQERMKAINKELRRVRKEIEDLDDLETQAQLLATRCNLTVDRALTLLTPDFANRLGFPAYALQNNNANIRRVRQRLNDAKCLATKVAAAPETVTEEIHGEIILVRDLEDNRLRLIFPGKPDTSTRTILKKNGFRWSPSNMAWQRQLTNSAEHAAKRVIELLT
jgi:hypothetical protein